MAPTGARLVNVFRSSSVDRSVVCSVIVAGGPAWQRVAGRNVENAAQLAGSPRVVAASAGPVYR